jgi:hypothetical protein
MQKLIIGLMASSILSLAAPLMAAAAGSGPKVEAKLAAPVSEPRKVVVDGRLWVCQADACKATAGQGFSQTLKKECAHVVKALGPIVAYSNRGRALSEADIAACNTAITSSTELTMRR